ncbi:hypothetical protein [Rhizobium grahamii]|uniref:Uncharacterized protein n=1 Tax=Rhizobium grahamii CCGE 502 TaxID=990285 RepID=S3H4J6_9HYPH|nr:hypothetical protein RGCCGE502_32801 [Rhizobium grahamii CCGE 502]
MSDTRRRPLSLIVGDELIAEPCREVGRAEMTQIVVEVTELRPQHQSEDPGLACALAETYDAAPAGRVGIGCDVEATVAKRKFGPAR